MPAIQPQSGAKGIERRLAKSDKPARGEMIWIGLKTVGHLIHIGKQSILPPWGFCPDGPRFYRYCAPTGLHLTFRRNPAPPAMQHLL